MSNLIQVQCNRTPRLYTIIIIIVVMEVVVVGIMLLTFNNSSTHLKFILM